MVFESDDGSGVGNEASRYKISALCSRNNESLKLTAIEAKVSCGRLEPFNADDAADVYRVEMVLIRGARNATQTRLEDNRNAIVYYEQCSEKEGVRMSVA